MKKKKKMDAAGGSFSYQKNFRKKKNRRLAESLSACYIRLASGTNEALTLPLGGDTAGTSQPLMLLRWSMSLRGTLSSSKVVTYTSPILVSQAPISCLI